MADSRHFVDELFDAELQSALRSDVLIEAMESAAVDRDDVENHLRGQRSRVLREVEPEIAAASEARRRTQAARDAVNDELPDSALTTVQAVASATAASLMLVGIVWSILGLTFGFGSPYRWIHHRAPVPVIIFGTLGLLYVVGRSTNSRVDREQRVREALGLPSLEEAEAETRLQLRNALQNRGFTEAAIEFINTLLEPSYDLTFRARATAGLTEAFDPRYEIPTAAAERLRLALDTRRGASIGIAGPRGVGKSTLLRSASEGNSEGGPRAKPRLGLVVYAPVEYQARDFVLHLYAALCRQVLQRGQLPTVEVPPRASLSPRYTRLTLVATFALMATATGLFLSFVDVTKVRVRLETAISILAALLLVAGATAGSWALRNAQRFARERRLRVRRDDLEQTAADRLQSIQFQQTYTTGYSGALKFPVGLEAETSRSKQLEELQRTLPEIIDNLRAFIGLVADRYQVVIGIDELDKIESAESATRFVNDVKAVFGVPAIFLVAVSEDAMSAFDRRGLPFRDAFDSAFDEIQYVDYLDWHGTQQLLNRRIVGLPVPFQLLCYGLSGGLPRDVLRVAREMLLIVGSNSARPLSAIAAELTVSELERKVRATTFAIRRLQVRAAAPFAAWLADGPSAAELLIEVQDLDASNRRLESFMAYVAPALGREFEKAETESRRVETERLLQLAEELLTFMYYAATLGHALVDRSKDQASFRDPMAPVPRAIELLATARQQFAISPNLAWGSVGFARTILDRQRVSFPELWVSS